MNAYVQEWIWRFSRATGVAKYVFLAIGRRTKRNAKGEFETGPLPVDIIANDTGMVDSTVRKHLKALCDGHGEIDIVKDSRRGEVYRYRLRRQLRIPLDADSPATSHRRDSAASPPNSGDGVTAELRRSQRFDSAATAPNGGGVSGDVSFSSEVRTEVLSTSTTYEREAADFLEWFCATYLTTRGFPYRVKREAAIAVVRELMTGRTVERLKAMALVLWSDTVDPWLNDAARPNDRGIFALRHKATYLELLVARAEAPATRAFDATAGCAHDPKCLNPWECQRLAREAVG